MNEDKNGKTQNVLFLVHPEIMFKKFFPDPLYALRLYRSIVAKKYDKVIILCSFIEGDEATCLIPEVFNGWLETKHKSQVWEWGWGYEPGMFGCNQECGTCFDCEVEKNIIPATGHEWTWIPEELSSCLDYYKQAKIYVGGGFKSECLEDWLCVFRKLEIKYNLIHGLIY